MIHQTCLRCGSPERYAVRIDGDNGRIHLSGTVKYLPVDGYVCGDCGYVERYVSASSLPLVRERGTRIRPS